MKNKTKAGRPAYVPVIPARKSGFTFADFEAANGVNAKTGKGNKCTSLTLRKFLKKDAELGRKSQVSIVKGELRAPASSKGLGRKCFVYVRTGNATAPTVSKTATVKAPKAAKAPKSAVSAKTASYEATKAALLAPTPAVTIAPVAPEPETAPAAPSVATPEPATV